MPPVQRKRIEKGHCKVTCGDEFSTSRPVTERTLHSQRLPSDQGSSRIGHRRIHTDARERTVDPRTTLTYAHLQACGTTPPTLGEQTANMIR